MSGNDVTPAFSDNLDIFVGRQPIYNDKQDIHAYELLFRTDRLDNTAAVRDGDRATSHTLITAILELGLDKVVGDYPAFINLTRSFILGNYKLPRLQQRLVLEILEDVAADAQIINAVQALAAEGYTIALDDFIYAPHLEPLIELAQIIKIDIRQLSRADLEQHVRLLRKWPVKLLAEKVETHEEFEFCRTLGFDYFQGYFLCKPNILRGKRPPANRIAIMQLITKLHDPDTRMEDVEALVSQDVTLSYRLLTFINSAHAGMKRKIDSMREALIMIGTQQIRAWASLYLLARLDDKPYPLLVTAMVRAKMCERLGRSRSAARADACFTVGLFSTLDAMLDVPMQQALENLPLSDAIKDALLNGGGELGQVLACTLAYERAQWQDIELQGFDAGQVMEAYLEAVAMANDLGPRVYARAS